MTPTGPYFMRLRLLTWAKFAEHTTVCTVRSIIIGKSTREKVTEKRQIVLSSSVIVSRWGSQFRRAAGLWTESSSWWVDPRPISFSTSQFNSTRPLTPFNLNLVSFQLIHSCQAFVKYYREWELPVFVADISRFRESCSLRNFECG